MVPVLCARFLNQNKGVLLLSRDGMVLLLRERRILPKITWILSLYKNLIKHCRTIFFPEVVPKVTLAFFWLRFIFYFIFKGRIIEEGADLPSAH